MSLRSIYISSIAFAAFLAVSACGGGGGGGNGGGGSNNATFAGVGDVPGGDVTSAMAAVNADGSVAVGSSNPVVARWTEATGITAVAGLGNGAATGVSGDGSIIIGSHRPVGGAVEGFSWTATGSVSVLPNLVGATAPPFPNGISDDGLTIVGQATTASGQRATVWRSGTAVDLGVATGGSFSLASATDDDGSIIVGQSGISGGSRAVRWTRGAGGSYGSAVQIPILVGGSQAKANAVNSDGSVIVGESGTNSPVAHTAAFRWTASGTVDLGDLPGGNMEARAYGVSGNGQVVVGEANRVSTLDSDAFIWTPGTGMQKLSTYLDARGVGSSLDNWRLLRATAISRDGKTIVGIGINPNGDIEGWVANLP